MSADPRGLPTDDPTHPLSADSRTAQERAAGDDLATGAAPTFRCPVETEKDAGQDSLGRAGDRLGDFELLRELGSGSFGRVFLARQVSLDRQVALKVSRNRGNEARTLASLEHDHIVHVFSETVDAPRGLRVLCMQYVPGTTLDAVIRCLRARPRRTWTGRAVLEAIDALSTEPATLDPAALADRERLAACDHVEAVCWIGSRLALALAHAHAHGVVHRDVKPANVLLNPYGRPLLADFNIALDRQRRDGRTLFGGTLAYMAPEHLDAFDRKGPATMEAVDERSDVYALGVVLFELLTGARPFSRLPADGEATSTAVQAMAAERRTGPAPLTDAPEGLARVIGSCLEPAPARRYQTAAELARALDGCRDLWQVEKELRPAGSFTRAVARHPFLWLGLLAFLPHVLGSAVNISYNRLRIILAEPSVVPAETFTRVTLAYNAVVYPLCLALIVWLVGPVWRAWQPGRREALDRQEAAALRRAVLRLPAWAAVLSALGWLPGGLVFPAVISWLSGPVGTDVFAHFAVSFTVAGLIALTYSVCGVQLVVLRGFYPRLWGDGQDLRPSAGGELRAVSRQLPVVPLLAGLIPLAGAVLMVDAGPDQFGAGGYRDFQILVTALIVLGMAGFVAALWASRFLGETVRAFTGGEPRGSSAGPGTPYSIS
jgi:serine/threonine protein kinase